MQVDQDIVCISTALKKNNTITELDLSYNDFSKNAALEIAKIFGTNTTLSKLSLKGSNIDDEVLMAITTETQKNRYSALSHLMLGDNQIGASSKCQSAIVSLVEVIDQNRLKVLDLHKNQLDDSSVVTLASALKNNYSLVFLNLRSNSIGDKGAQAIGDLLSVNITVKDVDISNNKIGPDGGAKLAYGLRSNTTLLKLNIRSNIIADKGAKEFAKVFSSNSNNVEELYLGYNLVHVEGALALAEMLKRNIKLKKFDMQGIILDLNSMKVVSESLKQNKSLVQFVIDVDSNSKEIAMTISEVLGANQTLHDLIIGGDVNFEMGEFVVGSEPASLGTDQGAQLASIKQKLKVDETTIAELQDRVYSANIELESQKDRADEMSVLVRERERALMDKENEITRGREKIEELETVLARQSFISDQQSDTSELLRLEQEKAKALEHQYKIAQNTLKYEQQMLEKYREQTRVLESILQNEKATATQQIDEMKRRSNELEHTILDLKRQMYTTDETYKSEISKLRDMESSMQYELRENRHFIGSQRDKVAELESKLTADSKKLEVLTNALETEMKKNEQHEDMMKSEQNVSKRLESLLQLERDRSQAALRDKQRLEDMISSEKDIIQRLERNQQHRVSVHCISCTSVFMLTMYD